MGTLDKLCDISSVAWGHWTTVRHLIRGMGTLDKLCVISFKGVAIDSRWCCDQMTDQVMTALKVQVMMVRGLCCAWKQPCFYEFSAPVTLEKLTQVVVRLEELGLVVAASVCDMGPANEIMWRQAGVTDQRTWIPRPSDHNRSAILSRSMLNAISTTLRRCSSAQWLRVRCSRRTSAMTSVPVVVPWKDVQLNPRTPRSTCCKKRWQSRRASLPTSAISSTAVWAFPRPVPHPRPWLRSLASGSRRSAGARCTSHLRGGWL